MPDVIEVGMFDLHKPHAQFVLIFIKSIITRVVFGYSVLLGLPCGSHVGYDLSHSNSKLALQKK